MIYRIQHFFGARSHFELFDLIKFCVVVVAIGISSCRSYPEKATGFVLDFVPDQGSEAEQALEKAIDVLSKRLIQSGIPHEITKRDDGTVLLLTSNKKKKEIDTVKKFIKVSGNLSFHLEATAEQKDRAGTPVNGHPSKNAPEGTIWLPIHERADVDGSRDQTGFLLVEAEPRLRGKHIKNAESYTANRINLEMTRKGSRRLSEVTRNTGRKLAIVLDQQIRMAPEVNERITGKGLQITGNFQSDETNPLVSIINSGALPGRFDVKKEGVKKTPDKPLHHSLGQLTITSPKTEITKYEPIFINVKGIVPSYELGYTSGNGNAETADELTAQKLEQILKLNVHVNGQTYRLEDLPYQTSWLGYAGQRTMNYKELENNENQYEIQAFYVLFMDPSPRFTDTSSQKFISSEAGTYELQVETRNASIPSNSLRISINDIEDEENRNAARLFTHPSTVTLLSEKPWYWHDEPDLETGRNKLEKLMESVPSSTYTPYARFLLEASKYADSFHFMRKITKNRTKNGERNTPDTKDRENVKRLAEKRARQNPDELRKSMKHLPKPSSWHLIASQDVFDSYFGLVRAGEMKLTTFRNYMKEKQKMYPDVITDQIIEMYLEPLKKEREK